MESHLVRLRRARRRGAVHQHSDELGRVYAELARRQPLVFVEIGSAQGGSLYTYAGACAPGATIIAVDLANKPRRRVPLRRTVNRLCAEGYRCHMVRGLSQAPDTFAEVKRILSGRPIDFLHIDGAHDYKSVKRDWELYSALLAPTALCAFHDISREHKGSRRFWREISREYFSRQWILGKTRSMQGGLTRVGIGLLHVGAWQPAPVCVYTPFGPGATWRIKLWQQSIENLGLPQGAQLVIMDNTGDSDTAGKLLAALQTLEVRCGLRGLIIKHAMPPVKTKHSKHVSARLAELWRVAMPHLRAETVLALESDVLAPHGTYGVLMTHRRGAGDIAAVAAACRSRSADHHEMAYLVQSLYPWVPRPKGEGLTLSGLQDVHAVHTGCTLFDAVRLKATHPTIMPAGATGGRYGCDWSICQELQQHGGRILIDWDLRCRHHQTLTEYV